LTLKHRFTATGITLGAALVIGCSSGNNAGKAAPAATRTASPTQAVGATSPAARPPASAPAAATAAAAPPRVTPTLSPIQTQSPEQAALTQKLTPLLLQQTDLPAGERSMLATAALPISNADYARNQQNATEVQSRLDNDGRLGGVQTGWSITGQYAPGQKVVNAAIDSISEFQTPEGAKDGLALIFANIQSTPSSPAILQAKATPLDVGTFGDETQAFRIEQESRTLAGTPTPSITTITQVFYVVGWRRNKAVAFVSLNAINEDPPLNDFKLMLQTQDQKLQAAGY